MSLLLGAATLVLLIAGVNVAAMLSARYLARRREMAVRAALGAGRSRLLRQLLTEVLALFLAGAVGGFFVASAATTALERLRLPANIPVSLELSPDLRVLAFALAVSLLTGLAFGLAPALQAARQDITPRLRADSAGAGVRRTLLSRALVAGQLALSLVLLVGAGLFMRALNKGQQIDPGFDPGGIATVSLEPESWGYDEPKARALYATLRERMQAVPGVAAVSYTNRLPLMMGSSPNDITLEDGTTVNVHTGSVDVDYFSVLHLPLVQGRPFLGSDAQLAPRVAVVNQTLARRMQPDGVAAGRTFRFRGVPVEIVGVARDAKYATLDERTPAFVYFPIAQVWQPTQSLLVRTTGDAGQLAPAVQQAIDSIDPLLPRPAITTLRQATSISLLPQRAAAIVTGVLGGVGLLLASVGLYGLMAFSASRRTREIGIRVALGAPRSNLLGIVIREGLHLAAAGIVIGLALAAASTPLLGAWLFGISPLDGITFIAMSAVFVAVALLASYLPARRAASLDPVSALRTD
jgi:predicted permease